MEQKEGIAEDQDRLLDPTPHEDIQAAALAMGIIEEMDPYLLDDEEKDIVRLIKKMSLTIAYQALFEIHEAGFYGPQDNEPT